MKQGNIKHLVMILHIGKKRTMRDGTPLPAVVAIVMSTLFGWAENFTQMAEFSYLASPSVYNKLLKFVVISWFVRGKIDCGLLQTEIVSDGDIVANNDLEEVTFVDFSLTDK